MSVHAMCLSLIRQKCNIWFFCWFASKCNFNIFFQICVCASIHYCPRSLWISDGCDGFTIFLSTIFFFRGNGNLFWTMMYEYLWIYLQLYTPFEVPCLLVYMNWKSNWKYIVYNNKVILNAYICFYMCIFIGFLFNIHKLCYTGFFPARDIWANTEYI